MQFKCHTDIWLTFGTCVPAGLLPIEVNNAVPDTPTIEPAAPPPLPPRRADSQSALPDDSMEQPPPIPARIPTLPR